MKAKVAALIFIGSIALVRADQMIESVQQALKDQGFYYGEITGETNANLTAAIRRYQIRNGLQVNGELNSETLRSLGVSSSASGQLAAKTTPSPSAGVPHLRDQSSGEAAGVAPPSAQPFANAPQDRQLYPPNPVTPGTSPGGLLAGTPYEAAPSWPAAGFIEVRSTEPMDGQWNCRCAPIKRGRVFLSQAGSIWKRLPRSDYCRGHANRSTIHRESVCVLRPSHQCAASGFRTRCPNFESPVDRSPDGVTILHRRSAPTAARRKLCRQKPGLRCEAKSGQHHPRPRSWRDGTSGVVAIQDFCQSC